VVDFIALRDELREVVATLDHYMLLPTAHPLIHVQADEQEVTVRFRDRRWVFPRGDCVLLPVANTTAELLAHYIGRALLERLERRLGARPTRLRVAVDECEGQWGVCNLENE
jgi:6-pyruvoyltetrahydropterin/6-carboxytetrahydropterin synthase